MPIRSEVECPHCGSSFRTTKILADGIHISCPRCAHHFVVLRSGEELIETIPIEGVIADQNFSSPLPPRAPSPEPPKRKIAQIKPAAPLHGARFTPFAGSRSAMALILIGSIAFGIFAFVNWYYYQVRALSRTADAGSARRTRQVKDLVAGKTDGIATGRVDVRGKSAALTSFGAPRPDQRIDAPGTMAIAKMVVGISAAHIVPVKQRLGASREDYLVLALRITNTSEKPLAYTGWRAKGATLRDNKGNYYNRISFDAGSLPEGALGETSIDPGSTIKDLLIFEAVELPTGALSLGVALELDLATPSGDVFRFNVPANFVERSTTSHANQPTEQVGQDGSPPPPMPYDPEQDPKLVQAVLVDYRAGIAEISSKSKLMAYDHARSFRRTAPDALLRKISTKYQLAEDQTRRILARSGVKP